MTTFSTLRMGLIVAVPAVALAGCVTTVQSGPQPETSVITCGPDTLEVQVYNTEDTAYRYTVSVEVSHDEMTETELVSFDAVAIGQKVTESIPVGEWEAATCRVEGVQSFEA